MMNVLTVGLMPSPSTGSPNDVGGDGDAGFIEELDRLGALPEALRKPARNTDRDVDKARIGADEGRVNPSDDTVKADAIPEIDGPATVDGEDAWVSDAVTGLIGVAPAFVSAVEVEPSATTATNSEGLQPPSVSRIDGEAAVVVPDLSNDVAQVPEEPTTGDNIAETPALRGEAPGTPRVDGPFASDSEAVQDTVGDSGSASRTGSTSDADQMSNGGDKQGAQPESVNQLLSEGDVATAGPGTSQSEPAVEPDPENLTDPTVPPVDSDSGGSNGALIDTEVVDPLMVSRPTGVAPGGAASDAAATEVSSVQTAASLPSGQVGTPGATAAATTPAMVSAARVLDMLEVMSRQPPPRTLTLDLTDLHGVRVTLALDGGGVNVSVSDSGAGNESAREWARQLDQLLSERDFGSGARSPYSSPQDRDIDSERSSLTPEVVSTTTTHSTELRL